MTSQEWMMNRFEIYEALAIRVVETEDGRVLWKESNRTDLVGREAGKRDPLGYKSIEVPGGAMIPTHRLVYFMHKGSLPEVIDHIDGDISNNRIGNLRIATTSQNAMNCRLNSKNTSGVKGVSFHKQTGKFAAHIRICGKQVHLGLFESIFNAACARRSAEIRHYGEFAT